MHVGILFVLFAGGGSNLFQLWILFASDRPSCLFYDEYSREQTLVWTST